ncbi:MAG: DUF2332 family protein [Rhodobacteraceae bacterium]|nr:DUF2332 family protein [Paracoccaceae bacterium]
MSLAAAFHDQARACAGLGSPFTARLLDGLADRIVPGSALADRLLNWPGDLSGNGASLPLRLTGGLHALVRLGRDATLSAAYADPVGVSDAALLAAALGAMARHQGFLLDWIESPPQTNEVRRSAVLIAAAHWLAARIGLPLVLSELGASAGLNLLWDSYALRIGTDTFGPPASTLTLSPDWAGPLPPATRPQVDSRAGVDLNPLDPVADRLRLLSYIWADQTDRIARTEAALDAAALARPPVARADAIDWLAARLAVPQPGRLHLIFHTVAWQYFPAATQTRGLALLQAAGQRATPYAPLAHLSMEADGQSPGAGLTLRLWPGSEAITLGRADFHGRWVQWAAPAA